jgi:hypothetical protein
MAKLIEKIPAVLVPVVQTLIATAVAALLAWLYSEGLITEVKQEIKAQQEFRIKMQEQITVLGK